MEESRRFFQISTLVADETKKYEVISLAGSAHLYQGPSSPNSLKTVETNCQSGFS